MWAEGGGGSQIWTNDFDLAGLAGPSSLACTAVEMFSKTSMVGIVVRTVYVEYDNCAYGEVFTHLVSVLHTQGPEGAQFD